MNEVIEAIRTLMKNTLGAKYKKYYYGEIRVPNQSLLPFMEIIPIWSKITNRWTGWMLSEEYQIQINVKDTLKKYLQSKTDNETLKHIQDLVKKIEDRDSDWNLESSTVLWVLHDNLQLSNTANIVWDWQITYDEIDLWDSYITLASISFIVKVITT